MNPDHVAITVDGFKGMLTHHPEAEIFENRQHVRQRHRITGLEQLEVQRGLIFFQRPIETHGQASGFSHLDDMIDIDHRAAG